MATKTRDSMDWLELIRAGDNEATKELLAELTRFLAYNFDYQTAQDAAQEAVIEIWREAEYRGEAAFLTWAKGVAFNRASNIYRESIRSLRFDGIEPGYVELEPESTLETFADLRHALDDGRITFLQYNRFVLLLAGFSVEDIALFQDVSIRAVNKSIERVRLVLEE